MSEKNGSKSRFLLDLNSFLASPRKELQKRTTVKRELFTKTPPLNDLPSQDYSQSGLAEEVIELPRSTISALRAAAQ